MSEPRVLRYEVPVDDEWHLIEFDGDIVHVASRDPSIVEFWTTVRYWDIDRITTRRRSEFRVIGTGQPFDLGEGAYCGTAITAGGALVWHLFSRRALS